MGNSTRDKGSQVEQDSQASGERLVYVMSEQALTRSSDDQIGLRELWNILWRGKWLIISLTATFALGSVIYAFLAMEWYRAEVLLAPAEETGMPSLGGELGGLAALAGVSVGGEDSAESVATLKSRELARAFIQEYALLTILFAEEWDAASNSWRDDDPDQWPDIRDAVKYFQEDVLNVSENRQTGLVTLAVEWIDAEVAAEWADALVRRLNSRLRERALHEAEANVAYLQGELVKTNVVTLQQSIGRLLESELQKVMLAQGNEEFAFRIIDVAVAPKQHVRPRRALIVVIATMLGGMLGVFGAFLTNAVRSDLRSFSGGGDMRP